MPKGEATRGKGRGYAFLKSLLGHEGDECIVFPLHRQPTGYGALGYNGKQHYAHRLMCEMANGPPPSPTHEAAHSCGNGRGGCVNPRHLAWKTISENNLDCRKHGTHVKHRSGPRGRLTYSQAQQIRLLRPFATQAELATIFKCSGTTIRDILNGRTHFDPSKEARRQAS